MAVNQVEQSQFSPCSSTVGLQGVFSSVMLCQVCWHLNVIRMLFFFYLKLTVSHARNGTVTWHLQNYPDKLSVGPHCLFLHTHTHVCHTDPTFWLRSHFEKAVYIIKCNLCGIYSTIYETFGLTVCCVAFENLLFLVVD